MVVITSSWRGGSRIQKVTLSYITRSSSTWTQNPLSKKNVAFRTGRPYPKQDNGKISSHQVPSTICLLPTLHSQDKTAIWEVLWSSQVKSRT